MTEAVLLDACVVINLRAAGLWDDVARASRCRFVIVEQVARESLYVLGDDGDLEPIDVDAAHAAGKLEIWSMVDDELALFVDLARRLDDGEAATIAVGAARRLTVATDDRVAIRVATGLPDPPRIVGTCDLVREWAQTGIARERVVRAIVLMRQRSRFVAPPWHSHAQWWLSHLPDDARDRRLSA